MSTVKLPDARDIDSGHCTGMDQATLLANIERLLLAKDLSADKASKLAGVPDAIRNLRRIVAGEKAEGYWKLDTLYAIAMTLEVPAWDLLRPEGALPSDARSREFIRSIVREEMGLQEPRPKARKAK